jgi:hypothetical protein
VFPTHHLQEVFHDIHDLCHLKEDEDLKGLSDKWGRCYHGKVTL